MCRHFLITATSFPGVTDDPAKVKQIKFDVLHQGMMLGFADDNQDSGWGMSDGERYIKNGGPYWVRQDFDWWDYLNADRMIQAHVRKASATTAKDGVEAAHPYMFSWGEGDKIQSLFAAHNGFITGTGAPTYIAGVPNTDSYRAFARLAALLDDNKGKINSDVMEKWLSEYHDDSQYAFTFYLGDELWALRGNRLLHTVRFGNGYIVHTSKVVLESLGFYVKRMWGIQLGEIHEITPDTLVRFRPGVADLDFFTVKPTWKPRYQGNYNNWPAAGAATRHTGVNPTVPAASATGNDVPRSAAGSQPNTTQTPAAPAAAGTQHDFANATQKAFNTIFANVAPMRGILLKFWIATSLNYITQRGGVDVDRVLKAPMYELQFFYEAALNGADSANVLSPRQKLLLNLWNHSINGNRDLDAQEQIFGPDPFFWCPELLRKDIDDDQAGASLHLMLGMWKGGQLKDDIWKALYEYQETIPVSSSAGG